MTVWVHSYLGDDGTIVVDGATGKHYTIKPAQWDVIRTLPNEEQVAALEVIEAANNPPTVTKDAS